ncbi:LytTR family transcriptional regulator DNA-binding domain-containing protein [Roseibacterium beibuensis]|uniref:LytTR family DNA-binding domain-containing protein n=1 Tax=[Roseibacterium] beibuensis TaxID=1193142 RepID=UPI00217CFA47|nr:LytTR family DNA-binding domain-containing protein [Roseibacterium beibuensis]MCS6626437.1 LytTR family transcriptional regulator DNA-binding domain-containing protein [Roseibacterium beibuensis]
MGASIEPDGDGRRLRLDIRLDRGVGVAVGAGVVLALTGAFGTDIVPLWVRFAYWVPLILVGAVWAHLCSRLIERAFDPDERPWLTIALLSAATAGPVVVLVWLVTGLVFENEIYPLNRLVHFIGPVLVVTVAISAINVFLGRSTPLQTHAGASGAAPARFLDRLPPRLRGATLHAVQAEDHYLRLHTDRGSDLILMRLSDAVAELEGLEGARTHRSWWVAREAVRGVSRGDGRASLTLEGGVVAPVSRRYARALREAGWY